jgi:outer membrane protein
MKLLALATAALASLVATTAIAQTQGPQNPGPVLPGVCVYFNQRMLAQSTVGQSVQTRMEQLAREVQGELDPYGQSIQSELQRLQNGGAAVTDADRQALQTRIQEAQQLEQTREAELRYTLGEQRRLISEAVEPILVASIQIVIHETSADLPIPRPDDIASCKTSKSVLPWFSLMCLAMSSSTSRCHLRGPVKCSSGVPLTPQGKANITNASGLSLIAGLHSRAISSCSSSGL